MPAPRSLGPLPVGLNILKRTRLVCQDGSSNKEYIGILAEDPRTGEFVGGCQWGAIGAPSGGQTSTLYRGPNINAAAAVVDTKLRSKLKGRGSSRYETEDGSLYAGFTASGLASGSAEANRPAPGSSRPSTPDKPAYRPRSIAEAMRRR